MDVMLPILDGLEHVHAAGFIHRDIKPPNIFIRDSGTPVLLDFGSARQSLGEHTRTLTTMVSPGYAPFEQYVSKSDKQGPWTDIYGLGATLYRAVTGKSPPNALDRSEALLHTGTDILVPAGEICGSEYSAGLLRAIDHALAFKADDRPRDIAAWRAEIEDAFDTDTAEDETELLPPPHAAAPPAEVQTHRVGRNDETAARSAGAMHQAEPDRSSRSKSILKWLGGTAALILLSALLMHWPADRTETAPDPRITAGADGAIDPAPVGIEPAAVAGVPQTAGAASRQEPTPPAQPPVTTTAPDVLSADDRRKLALLRERLRANAEDDASDQLLQQTIKDYTDRAQAALDQGDQARAEAYVNQLRQVAPNNMKIEQALKKIRKAKFKKQGT
jgi:serine/threonine protein kinase